MNSIKISNLTKIIVSFFVLNSFLLCIEYKDLIEKLKQQDEKIEKLKVEYTQLINFLDLKEVYELKADFVFLKPDKIKVNIYEPFQQIIVVDKNKILIKDVNQNVVYKFNPKKFFEKEFNYLPLIFSKRNYTVVDFIKKTGLKYVTENENCYVLSTRYAKGKVYTDKKIGLRPGEIRFLLWIDKQTLYPTKVSMISEKYIIETEFKNYQTEFEIKDTEFEILDSSTTQVIEIN